MPPKKKSTPVKDMDPRSYMGGSYLNVMVGKLSIVQVNPRWGDKTYNTNPPTQGEPFLGFRGYRTYRTPCGTT